ncbi:MAG: hypothetical protein J5954_11780, partial [Prevotella sp.]|nr:hypothetical protein [Prevotella sp.]
GKVVSLKVKSTLGGNLRLRTANALKTANGTALATATGDNSNPLMQPYVMPDPIVANPSKIPATTLPATNLYDIPTTAGQELHLVDEASATGITEIPYNQHPSSNTQVYDLMGRRVNDSFRGIVVVNGSKCVRR